MDWPSLPSQAWKLWFPALGAKSGDEVTRYLISMATGGTSLSPSSSPIFFWELKLLAVNLFSSWCWHHFQCVLVLAGIELIFYNSSSCGVVFWICMKKIRSDSLIKSDMKNSGEWHFLSLSNWQKKGDGFEGKGLRTEATYFCQDNVECKDIWRKYNCQSLSHEGYFMR